MGLDKLLGCRETDVQTAKGGRTTLRWDSPALLEKGETLPARWFEETLTPVGPQATIVARFSDGAAAAVLSTFGKGKTLTLGSYVAAAYQTQPSPAVQKLYSALLDWAHVDRPIRVDPVSTEVHYLENGNDRLLFVFGAATVSLPGSRYTARDIVTGKPVAVEADGSIRTNGLTVLHLVTSNSGRRSD
jgi:hypothetical protein